MNRFLLSLLIVLFLVGISACEDAAPPIDPKDPPKEDPHTPGIGEARDISSFDLVAEMGVGWNLGNSFDVTSKDKTLWGNPLTSKAVISAVKNKGFKTLRIPITWGYNQSAIAPYTIESGYLNNIKRVVDYGFQNEMHVIINVHHDNDWSKPIAADADRVKERLSSLWTQVSEHFKEYNDSLIFETLNEPRLEGSPQEWSGGTPEGRSFINEYHKAAVDAIRATGGNNAKRHIMIPTWAASTVTAAMNDLIVPNDDPKVIISLHTYFPWQFAGEASRGWGSDQDKTALQGEFDKIRQKWIVDQGRPVILGEWGSIKANDTQTRLAYAEFYAENAASRGLLTIVWDDGGNFQLLDRRDLTWPFGNIADVIISASN